jgi:hypothetical protein
MLYDDEAPPFSEYRPPYSPWDESPVVPATDQLRQAIRDALSSHPQHFPAQIKLNLWRDKRIEASTAEICGVKAGM